LIIDTPSLPPIPLTPPTSPRRLSRLRLGNWLMATVLFAVFLAVLSCALLIENFARAHAERRAMESLQQISTDFRDALDRGMAQQFREVRLLAQLEPFRRFDDPASVRRALDQVQQGFNHFAWIGLTDPQGRVLAAAGGLLEGADVSKRPWWQAAQNAPFVGDVHGAVLLEKLLPKQREPWRFVDFAVPIKGTDGALQGVLGAHLSWGWARQIKLELIDAVMSLHEAEALVIARDGTVLLGPPGTEGKPFIDTAGSAHFSFSTATQGQGDYPGLGWRVLLRKPVDVALADYFQLRRQIMMTALMLLALAVPLAWWVARRLSAPLVQLAAAIAARHHLGEALIPRVGGYREAELLSDALAELSARQAEQDAMLEHRVTERTAELEQAMQRLEASERRLNQLTRIDPLTGGPNRRQFEERLPEALARSHRNGALMALLFLDIDKFKQINDSLGHAAGDTVLKEFALRLCACVRGTDTVARLGGDEFVLILEGLHAQAEAEQVAVKILEQMARSFDIGGTAPLAVSTSIGLACNSGAGAGGHETDDAAQLLARADAALYAAKAAGRGTYRMAPLEA